MIYRDSSDMFSLLPVAILHSNSISHADSFLLLMNSSVSILPLTTTTRYISPFRAIIITSLNPYLVSIYNIALLTSCNRDVLLSGSFTTIAQNYALRLVLYPR
jgi:hypothetical protein